HTIVSIKNDGHYFCRAGGNRPDGLNEPVTGNVTFAILLKMCHLWEPAINPVCRICITVPDERKTYVAVKKPTLLPALVIAVK
ncbi:hypothetical protein SNB42_15180, partial [Escherichia coli]|nr:hypothetical protein [Escherichia coli]MDZ8496837.1 hypothetical protein [Escherichia coli]